MGKRIEIAMICALIIGLLGYSAAGLTIAGDRIATAERTLDSVVSHQNRLNANIRDINSRVTTLGVNSAFDAEKAIALVDESISSYEQAAKTVGRDDVALSSVERQLIDQRWLTMVSAKELDRVHDHVGHARRALAMARTLVADGVLGAQFWRALYLGLADLMRMERQKSAGDLTSARATLAQTKIDVNLAADLSSSPGLPVELQSLTADLQKFTADYGSQLDALAAGDYEGITAYGAAVSADASKIGQYNIEGIGAQIDAYFRPLIDAYDREIAAATS